MKVSKIQKKIEKTLDEKRYNHSLGVAYTASCLAMKYDVDINKAYLAGILHDCAKNLSDDKRLELAQKYDIFVSKVEKENPFLLHGKIGALIAKKKFKIDDEDILNAISFHTTGRPSMSTLEKIIYISDYIEINRMQASNLNIIRKLAFEDLDLCLIKILEDTLDYLKNKNACIDPETQNTYDYYIKEKLINDRC